MAKTKKDLKKERKAWAIWKAIQKRKDRKEELAKE